MESDKTIPLLGQELLELAHVAGLPVAEGKTSQEVLTTEFMINVEFRTMTGEDILKLCQSYGIQFVQSELEPVDEYLEDLLESEITLVNDESGVFDDNGVLWHYRYKAYYTEYPEEGVIPLGEPLNKRKPSK